MTRRKGDVSTSSPRDFEVGYGKPPKDTQFKPGQSGNPKGRKRQPKSVKQQAQKVLSKKVTINEAGGVRSLTMHEVILRNLAKMAAKGDLKAANFIFSLIHSPEFADTETLDTQSLSAEDQRMVGELMRQIKGEGAPGQQSSEDTHSNETSNPVAPTLTADSPSDDAALLTDETDAEGRRNA